MMCRSLGVSKVLLLLEHSTSRISAVETKITIAATAAGAGTASTDTISTDFLANNSHDLGYTYTYMYSEFTQEPHHQDIHAI